MPKGSASRPTKRPNKPGTGSLAAVRREVDRVTREEIGRMNKAGLDPVQARKRERIKRK